MQTLKRRPASLSRVLRAVSSWAWIAIPVGLVLFSLWASSIPCGHFFAQILLFYGWALAIGTAILVYFVRVFRQHRIRPGIFEGTTLTAFVSTFALLTFEAPMMARFALSLPAMNDTAKRVMAEPKDADEVRRIGLWPVEDVTYYKGGMRFLVRGSGFIDQCGFAYVKSGKPPEIGDEDYYDHLHGDWYVWTESF